MQFKRHARVVTLRPAISAFLNPLQMSASHKLTLQPPYLLSNGRRVGTEGVGGALERAMPDNYKTAFHHTISLGRTVGAIFAE